MATIISKNFYLTNTQMDDNSGLIGYQNLVTPSTITATSQLSSDPITSAANPATAWGWVAGDQPAAADAIEYTGTNYMPSPFNPSGWPNNPSNTSIVNTVELNPSGELFVGEVEQVGAGTDAVNSFSALPVDTGDYVFCGFIFKNSIGENNGIRVRFGDSSGFLAALNINIFSGLVFAEQGDISEHKIEAIGGGYTLVQVKYNVTSSDPSFSCQIRYTGAEFIEQVPPIGNKIKLQAAYFGKADDWPAQIQTAGEIPAQTITINTGGQQVDYIGIAKHNLNQIGLTVAIKYNGITVVPAQPVSEKQALLFLNNIASPDTVELIISGATSPPRIAVLYVGKALRLQRNIYVGHTPISYGRNRTAINGVSENGQYLGEIVVRELNTTSVNLQNLTPDWYRQNLDPFFALSPRVPCFWAWRPSKYEDEVGYCWVEGDPQMSNQRSNGMVQCSWNFKGIV